jgi:hypothetical protein
MYLNDLRAVVAQHPGLGPDGFGSLGASLLTPAEGESFEWARAWLVQANRGRRPLVGTHWLACIASRLRGTPVSDGAVIAAALALGLARERDGKGLVVSISLPWVRSEDERSHRGGLRVQTIGELSSAVDSDRRALRHGVAQMGPWRMAPACGAIEHARVRRYKVDADRIKDEASALETVVHISRKAGVFDDSDVGSLLRLLDALGFIGAGRGGARSAALASRQGAHAAR